jgi:hypothetical protein
MSNSTSTIPEKFAVQQSSFGLWWLVLFVCFTLGGGAFGQMSASGEQYGGGIMEVGGWFLGFVAGAFLGPVIAMMCASGGNRSKMEALVTDFRADFEKIAGAKMVYSDVGVAWHGTTIKPSAIGFDGEKVYIVQKGMLKTLTRDDIRSWQWRIERGNFEPTVSTVYVNTVTNDVFHHRGDPIGDVIGSAQARAVARENSGLFVKCRDIENPTWKFTSSNQKILEKWAEILHQFTHGEMQQAQGAA